MPVQHARKAARRDDVDRLKRVYKLKHREALKFLALDDGDERELLLQLVSEYLDINTYAEAVDYLTELRNAPVYFGEYEQCPECWEYDGDCRCDDPDRDIYCHECGAGSSGPYDECTCYDEDNGEQKPQPPADDGDYDKDPPRNDPEPPDDYPDDDREPVTVGGGWGGHGSSVDPFGEGSGQ